MTPEPWRPPAALLVEQDERDEYASLRESRSGATLTSYTRLRGVRAGGRAWAEEAEARRAEKGADAVDEVPGTTLKSSRASGVFVHEVLERVPLASFGGSFEEWRARADVSALLDETIAVHRVEPEQRAHAERLVWSAYTTPVVLPDGRTLPRLANAARVVREMEFVFPVPRVADLRPRARSTWRSSTRGSPTSSTGRPTRSRRTRWSASTRTSTLTTRTRWSSTPSPS